MDRRICVDLGPASPFEGSWMTPGSDCLRVEPQCQLPTFHQSPVVLRPVANLISEGVVAFAHPLAYQGGERWGWSQISATTPGCAAAGLRRSGHRDATTAPDLLTAVDGISCASPLTTPMTQSLSTRPRERGVRQSSSHRPGRRTLWSARTARRTRRVRFGLSRSLVRVVVCPMSNHREGTTARLEREDRQRVIARSLAPSSTSKTACIGFATGLPYIEDKLDFV